ncbi:MAG TPA: hypothetical protein DCE80_03025 [Ignavibacteriales bacterium]|nr:hypothetical protein [Ignavibacteriales bacterium]
MNRKINKIAVLFFIIVVTVPDFSQTVAQEKIFFAARRDSNSIYPLLYMMNVDGSNIHAIKDSIIGYVPRLSRDGKRIAYIGTYSDQIIGPPQVRVMNVDGTNNHVVSLCKHPITGQISPCEDSFSPAWSADGEKIAYDRCNNCEAGGDNFDIYIVNTDTTQGYVQAKVTQSLYSERLYDWSPDGSKLLFRAHYFNNTYDFDGELFLMNTDGTNWKQLTNGIGTIGPRYSPDGATIAFFSNHENKQLEIYLMDTTGVNIRRLTNLNLEPKYATLSWSPDGKKIVFESDFKIFVLDVLSLAVIQIPTNMRESETPEWGNMVVTNVTTSNYQNVNKYFLYQNYPNPFNPSTVISWQSPVGSQQVIKLFDVIGNEVATLINEWKEAGSHSLKFDASDLSSGVYYYKLTTDNFSSTKKMILTK